MYVAMRKRGTSGQHIDVTIERGLHPGTWEVSYDSAGLVWRARAPGGREEVLGGSEAWIGELGRELDELMCQVARRAVGEAVRRLGARARVEGRVREVKELATHPTAA